MHGALGLMLNFEKKLLRLCNMWWHVLAILELMSWGRRMMHKACQGHILRTHKQYESLILYTEEIESPGPLIISFKHSI